MSIKSIARELYRTQQNVDALEKQMAAENEAKQRHLHDTLRLARQELAMIRKILDGEKERGTSQTNHINRI